MKSLGAPKDRGFGLLDLMIAVVVMSLLVAVAVPSYQQFVVRAKNARAIGDIGSMSIEIDRFRLKNNGALPNSLNELSMEIPLDPWNNPYQYLNMIAAGPLTAEVSRDDIVRANNGAFIGLGEDY